MKFEEWWESEDSSRWFAGVDKLPYTLLESVVRTAFDAGAKSAEGRAQGWREALEEVRKLFLHSRQYEHIAELLEQGPPKEEP